MFVPLSKNQNFKVDVETCTPKFSICGAETGGLEVQYQPVLQSEFQASLVNFTLL